MRAILTIQPGSEVHLSAPCDEVLFTSRYSGAVEVVSPITASAVESQLPSGWLTADVADEQDWFDKDSKHWNWQDSEYDDGRFAKRQAELTETSN